MVRRLVSSLVFLTLVGSSSAGSAAPLSRVVAGYDPERGTFVRTEDGRWELNPYAMVQLTRVTSGQGFREADLEDSRAPKVSLAVAGAYNPERIAVGQSSVPTTSTLHHVAQGVAEATLRYRGLSLTNELHVRRQAIDGAPHAWDTGGFAQVGFFVVPSHLQLVSRLARVAGTVNNSDLIGEETLGVSYYFFGHRFKVHTDGSHLETRASREGWRARLQLEFFL
jgi:hypothetical protein